MADQKAEEKRHAEMLEGLNKGIKEANGQMSDHEFVLIKRAKKALRQGKRGAEKLATQAKAAIGDLLQEVPGAGAIKQGRKAREEQLREDEQ